MNIQEFAALKVGDKVENAATYSKGEITKTVDAGVFVVWGTRSALEREFFYSAVGTAWFQWNKPGAESGASS